MADNEVIVQIGIFGGMLATFTALWYKVTSKFVRKDILALHIETLNKTFESIDKDSTAKWDAISNLTRDQFKLTQDQSKSEGMLTIMMNNRNKRKDD